MSSGHLRFRRGDRVAQLAYPHGGRPRRKGRARRFLDAHVHQLASHALLRSRVGRRRTDDRGLVIVGVHTPEFPFEQDVDDVREAVRDMSDRVSGRDRQRLPVWRAFGNRYWPAAILRRRGGRSSASPVRRRSLRRIGAGDPAVARTRGRGRGELVSVAADGVEARRIGTTCVARDLSRLRPRRATSPRRRHAFAESRHLRSAGPLRLNHWGLSGEWTIGSETIVLNDSGGRIAFRFHARDAHLVLSSGAGRTVPFRVLVDGEPLADHTASTSTRTDTAWWPSAPLRARSPARPRPRPNVQITFLDPGIEAYSFTFG